MATRTEFAETQVLLMAAAPADFRAREATAGKLERGGEGFDLSLEPTEDILCSLEKSEGQTVVAFAAEHGHDVDRARDKLTRKNADLIVLNDVSNPEIGFESKENAAILIGSTEETSLDQAPKETIAERILDRVDQLRSKSGFGATERG
jgi:phosphopantothenoylcysteine decarboxylase/phosphopantothenate--cysteine ligase